MSDEHTHRVTVEFTKQLHEHETPEDYIEACLTGSRSNNFTRNVKFIEHE